MSTLTKATFTQCTCTWPSFRSDGFVTLCHACQLVADDLAFKFNRRFAAYMGFLSLPSLTGFACVGDRFWIVNLSFRSVAITTSWLARPASPRNSTLPMHDMSVLLFVKRSAKCFLEPSAQLDAWFGCLQRAWLEGRRPCWPDRSGARNCRL